MEGQAVPFGILDITLYRDDLTTIAPNPVVKPTKFPEPINDKVIVLVDDSHTLAGLDLNRHDLVREPDHRRGAHRERRGSSDAIQR